MIRTRLFPILLLLVCSTLNGQTALPKSILANFPTHDTLQLLFIGDVMQHGKQVKAALACGNPKEPANPTSYKYSTAFRYIEQNIREADYAVANMEFPVGDYPYGFYPNFNAPVAIASQAKRSGIDIFLTANNHMADMGSRGLLKTLDIYDTLGVTYIGAYRTKEEREAREPLIISKRGIRVALINFCYGLNCALSSGGVVNFMDSTLIKSFIERAKQKGADIICALPHWGDEYRLMPNHRQEVWAEMLFKNGVQLIVGAHPHVPQLAEIELFENTITGGTEMTKGIWYSLGNYISNQSTPDYTQLELMVEIQAVRDLQSGEITLAAPKTTFLWCFKAGEYEENYTVVPIDKIIENPQRVRDTHQLERALSAYRRVMEMGLIKTIRHNRL